MTSPPDEHGSLAAVLRNIPTAEPSPDFVAATRRRYAQALEARYRREVLLGLVSGSAVLAVAASVLLIMVEPATLVGSGALVVASLTRWITAVAVVASIVPLSAWLPGVAGLVVSALCLLLLIRTRMPAVAK